MRVLILGVGDAFTRKRFGSSAVIEAPEGLVLIDCPDLIHRAVLEASERSGWNPALDAGRITDILLTHLHGDHCNGLESLGFHRRILRMRDPATALPRVHVSSAVADRLWQRLAPAMDAPMGSTRPSQLSDFFDVRTLSPDQPSNVAGLSVRCRPTRHTVPTLGFLVSDGDRTLGWSADTPFEQAHIDWLSAADVIVHESNLGPAHTPIESLNALPESIRRKMRLIHLPDDFDPRQTDITILRESEVLRL
jgi:ribonuclease BN (tRNA processing enzyme)